MRSATERWLAELQERFGTVLRTPLSTAGNTLHPDVRAYSARAVDDVLPGPKLTAAERLSVYHRQYWLRLLQVVQEQYPLSMRLCGAWGFNQHAIAFLVQRPPRGCDLGDVVTGFDDFLSEHLQTDPVHNLGAPALPRAALLEAARLDAAYRRVFMAPEEPAFQVGTCDVATQRVALSRALAIVDESWPLLALRARIFGKPESHPVRVPPALPQPRSAALYRTTRGVAQVGLALEEARLLALLREHTVGTALAIIESECDAPARLGLPERTQQFLASAVRRGFFTGFV